MIMKKTLAMLLALAMGAAMLTACGSSDGSSDTKDTSSAVAADDSSAADTDTSEDDASKEDDTSAGGDSSETEAPKFECNIENEEALETDERMFEELVSAVAESGEFTVNADIKADGMELVMYVTTNGTSTFIDMQLMGTALTVMSNDDGEYILDTEGKKYYFDDTGSMNMSSAGEELIAGMTTLDGLTYRETCSATVNGDECIIEKYINGETSIEVSYIFDADGKLVLVGNGDMYMPFEFTASVDASKFSIDGYTEMTDEEFVEWFTNMGA